MPVQPFLSACTNKQGVKNDNTHPVVIIGAGAAGLISGYLLKQQGVSVKILEAASNFGGRMKRTTDFADFPIPLGAEWIHVKPNILSEIVNDDSVNIDVKVEKYNPDIDYALYEGEKISIEQIEMNKESKFVNSTWFDFFEQYIVPSVEKHIIYGAVVEKIDYLADEIKIETFDKIYLASRVVLTVPVKVLQQNKLTFIPELPKSKQDAINSVKVWSGFKAFIEFSDKFYPALIGFNPTTNDGEKLYYDATYGQNSNQHILGLFAVGNESLSYLRLTDEERVKYILHELDKIFDGKASAHYVKHIFQNWDIEPHINGAYIRDNEDWTAVKKLGESVDGRLFFAGDAYTDGEDWSAVHNAVHSAKRAVQAIMGS
ncbi:FAD-dependent oxidoreductase [Pseudoalteromonas luteoviolacea]|nr:NAD(P)/FAD-dependent oxidoreductase [Pseudoalteromonas luteoviolacea]MBQ4810600.1 FAD-dependent oxidoreductase [Pseudoalteromonas luteoviolacea]